MVMGKFIWYTVDKKWKNSATTFSKGPSKPKDLWVKEPWSQWTIGQRTKPFAQTHPNLLATVLLANVLWGKVFLCKGSLEKGWKRCKGPFGPLILEAQLLQTQRHHLTFLYMYFFTPLQGCSI